MEPTLNAVKSKGSSFAKEFKEFAVRGNVIDLAVGVMIGSAFNPIVQSLVNDIIMPPIGLLLGKVDFSSLFIDLSGRNPQSIAQAKEWGAATINYGVFLNTVLNFVIVAFVVFLLIRQINRLKRPETPAQPTTKKCPHCLSDIPLAATKCAHCTSALTNQPQAA